MSADLDGRRAGEMSCEPLITIIVAVYNHAGIIQRCIDSVDNQTYPKKELIIIDGGSTDGSVNILRHNNDKITYWKSEPDNGIYHAWNKALDHAKGDWIYFLGSDDYFWNENVLEDMVPHLIKAESQPVRVMYGQVAVVTENDEVLYVAGDSWECTYRRAITDGISTFPHQAIFHHRSLFEIHGRFDESFQIAGDYELLVRELKSADAHFINGLIVAGMQTGGISSNTKIVIKEIARARRKNRLRAITIPWLIWYAWAICYPFLKCLIGKRGMRYLGNFGGRLMGQPSYNKEKVILERENAQ